MEAEINPAQRVATMADEDLSERLRKLRLELRDRTTEAEDWLLLEAVAYIATFERREREGGR